jgi:hypothetical protein
MDVNAVCNLKDKPFAVGLRVRSRRTGDILVETKEKLARRTWDTIIKDFQGK